MVSESKLSSSESIALKAISGVGLAIFTALMVVHWNHVLSKVQTAEETAPQTATTTTTPPATPSTTTNAAAAPPVAASSSVTPSTTSTSGVATSSTTVTPTTPTSSATAPLTTTPTPPTSESTSAVPPTTTATAPITTATPPDSTTAPVSESATTMPSTPVETTPAAPNTLAAVESTPATASNSSSSADVEALKTQLYDTLDQAWTQYPSFSQDLVYKVTVGGDGSIVDYQPIHQAAVDYLNETPLDGASTNSTATGTDFMVVMTPSGILEVNPWIGK